MSKRPELSNTHIVITDYILLRDFFIQRDHSINGHLLDGEIYRKYFPTPTTKQLNQIKELQDKVESLQQNTQNFNTLNSKETKKQDLELLNLEQDYINKKLQNKKLCKELGLKNNEIIMPKITLLQYNSAKARIQNHLSYKLGQIIIRNSKSLYVFIKLPYLLMALTLIHKEQEKIYKEKIKANPKLALPPLESYKDYKDALKEKECFTYKLGQAFMKGYKIWYKGGLVKFYFEAKRLEREFKNKKAKQG